VVDIATRRNGRTAIFPAPGWFPWMICALTLRKRCPGRILFSSVVRAAPALTAAKPGLTVWVSGKVYSLDGGISNWTRAGLGHWWQRLVETRCLR